MKSPFGGPYFILRNIVKWGKSGVGIKILFLKFLLKIICYAYILESPWRGVSDSYTRHRIFGDLTTIDFMSTETNI